MPAPRHFIELGDRQVFAVAGNQRERTDQAVIVDLDSDDRSPARALGFGSSRCPVAMVARQL